MKKFFKILNGLAEQKDKNINEYEMKKHHTTNHQVLTFFQLRILIDRGGVGAEILLFKLASNPIAWWPEAVVLSSVPSSQVP